MLALQAASRRQRSDQVESAPHVRRYGKALGPRKREAATLEIRTHRHRLDGTFANTKCRSSIPRQSSGTPTSAIRNRVFLFPGADEQHGTQKFPGIVEDCRTFAAPAVVEPMWRRGSLLSCFERLSRFGDEAGDSRPHVGLVRLPVPGFHPQVEQRTAHARPEFEPVEHTRYFSPEPARTRVMPGSTVELACLSGNEPNVGNACRHARIAAMEEETCKIPCEKELPSRERNIATRPGGIAALLQTFPQDVRAPPAGGPCRPPFGTASLRFRGTPREHVRCRAVRLPGLPGRVTRFRGHMRNPQARAPVPRSVRRG